MRARRVLHPQGVGEQFPHGRDLALIEIAHKIDRVQPERPEPAALAVREQALELVHREGKIDGIPLFDDDVRPLVQPRLVAIERR